jgi:hypothetical protein
MLTPSRRVVPYAIWSVFDEIGDITVYRQRKILTIVIGKYCEV